MNTGTQRGEDDVLAGLPKPGEIIAGKYVVEEVIGAGGMGAVVAAKHAQLGHKVAIKFLLEEFVGFAPAVQRFLREARAAVAIKSEHVARVIDVGELETGAPYMIMEFLTGCDLQDVLDERDTLPVAEALDYVLQACEALAEAHANAVVHRDLKPSNLFVAQRADGSPLVKVLDFGIAKALDEMRDKDSPSLTTTGSALGTPMYMSPEQVRDAKSVDPRTDIWGLGTVLFHLLGGAPPFDADTVPAMCAKIIADEPPSLRALRPDVPEALEAVILRCLEKKVDARYQTVADFALALGPFAPPAAQLSIERIVRVVEGPMSAEESGRWVVREGFASTVASDPGQKAPPEARAASTSAGVTASAGAEMVNTAAPWQTGSRPARKRQLLAAVVAAAAVAGALVWVLMSRPDESAAESSAAVAASEERVVEAEPIASEAPRNKPAAAAPSASAAASTSATATSSVKVPPSTFRPPAAGPRPTIATATAAPPPASTKTAPPPAPKSTGGKTVDPLLDRN